jgi:hypothetical protein
LAFPLEEYQSTLLWRKKNEAVKLGRKVGDEWDKNCRAHTEKYPVPGLRLFRTAMCLDHNQTI